MLASRTTFVSNHKLYRWKLLAIFTVVTMLMSLVVQTSFGAGLPDADAAGVLIPTLDDGGPDDNQAPNRTDLSQMGFNPEFGVGQVETLFSFDNTDFSGGTVTAGYYLFDIDEDGLANYAVGAEVGVIGTDTGALLRFQIWDCKDSKADQCLTTGGGGDGSAGLIAEWGATDPAPLGTTMSAAIGPDPFDGSPDTTNTSPDTHNTVGGSVAPDPIDDIVISAVIALADLFELEPPGTVATTSPILINVCSYTSADPGSDAKDCVINPGSGLLQIVKNTSGGDGAFSYTLTPDGSVFATVTTTGGSGSSEALPVEAGTYNLAEVVPTGWNLDSATCSDGSSPSALEVGAGERVTCTFNNSVSVVAPDITVDKTANPTTVDEPGGLVTFSVVVTNNAPTPTGDATLDSLSDDIHGDLNGQGDCSVPQTLLGGGGTYSCSFTATVSGGPGDSETDTVTAVASNSGGSDTASDDALVTITDTPSAIEVLKTATPDNVDEPGGSVTYTFVVNNLSTADSVTIDTLDDSIYGNLNGQGDCSVPQTIAAGGSYSCSITENVSGNAGATITNVATASGTDDDGNSVSDDDDAIVTVNDVPSAIEILKTATPDNVDEPGGSVTYSFVVNNLSTVDSVAIDTLDDSIYGDLNGQGDCSVPQTIAAGGSYSCSFTTFVSSTETNVVTASGTDDDGNPVSDDDDATVTVTDVPSSIDVIKTANPTSVAEPGGDVTYTFTVNNTSLVDSVTISSLSDSIYGDLNGQGDCSVPQTIAASGSYSCSLTVFVSGNADQVINNVLTVAGTDDDGNPVGGSDDADVTIDDVPSSIDVIKTANPTSVAEPGGDVTYTFTVNNTSLVDSVTISSLSDSIYGDLNGQGDCSVPQTIAASGSYSCSLTVFVSGNADQVINNVLTVAGTDDDGNPVGGSDDADVTIDDVPSSIDVIKTANPTSVAEPGGDVTYTFTVNNTSAVDSVTISSLSDSIYGDLNGQGDCSVPQTIAASGSYSCSLTVFVSGNADQVINNVLTVAGTDDDGNPVGGSDDADVTITDVPSSIEVVKTAGGADDDTVLNIAEPGGPVGFSVTITNTSLTDTVNIDAIVDSIYGNLIGATDSDCVAVTLAPGASTTCTFDRVVSGNAGDTETNIVTASGTDDDGISVSGSDDAVVTITDVPSSISTTKTANPTSVLETGGDVTFTIVVENTSLVDTVTLNSVVDTAFGDVSASCAPALPADLLPNESVTCTFTEFLSADDLADHYNVATASGEDDDGNPVADSDDETVTFTDVAPEIRVTKSASPSSVPETGGDVTFTFLVENIGQEDVTLTSLTDTVFGDLNGQGDCATGGLIVIGDSYSCSITVNLSADDLADHVNVATAIAVDDDGTPAEDSDDETVTFTDVAPEIRVTKSASPSSVPETGGDVTFTFLVENIGQEDVTLTSLTDTVFGDLNGQGDCATGGLIVIGDSYSCSITVNLSADDLADHVNVATAIAVDDDGTPAEDSDDETVTFTDVAPEIQVTKTADPTSVPETGGDVTFTFLVENIGQEDVTLTSLTDTVFGDLNGQGDCVTGGLISIGGDYSCSITVNLSADDLVDHVNVVTAVATDDDGTTDEDSDDETVTFDDVLPDVSITKTADPISVPEPGANVEFTIVVTNNSLEDAAIDALVDSDFDLAANCADAVGTVLGSGASYTCVFTEFIAGNVGEDHQNTATVVASDDDGNSDTESDSADVTIDDVAPAVSIVKDGEATINEGGDTATYDITITNDSVSTDPLTVTSLNDDKFGDLLPEAEAANGGPITLNPGDSFTFSIDRDLTLNVGETHTNVVTVVGVDDEGTTATDNDDHTVGAVDVAPAVSIVKDGEATINEGGDTATYDITITNDSVSTDPLTVTSLNDDKFGDLLPEAEAADGGPITLNPGDSFTFSIDRDLTLNVGETHTNVVTVVGVDDEGTTATDNDDHTVGAVDVAPAVSIVKDGEATINEGGDTATYDITITNDSVSTDPLTITSLNDDQFGDLLLEAEAARGGTIVLASGESFTFQITRSLEFNVGDTHTNVVTVVGVDDEGTEATDNDDHTVAFDNVDPVIDVTKTPNQDQVFAPGEDVVFTIRVENNSVSTDPVTITSLIDDVFGDVSAECVLPQTIGSGGAFECDITRSITADHTNTVTATAVDDEGTEVTDSASADVEMINPSIDIEKSTNGFDADAAPGPEILVDADVTWTYLVTNDGDVDLENIIVTDSVLGDVCTIASLAAGTFTTCELTGTAAADDYANTGTADVSYTDLDGDVAERSDSDDSHYFGAAPSVDIVKTFADDSVIAGGAGSSFTLVVTNDGNVDLDDVSVFDEVDDRLTVTGVSGTAGADDDSDSETQTVEWLIANLGAGESATITVNFTVASDVEEANGVGDLNDAPPVGNTATVSDTYIDASGNSLDISDSSTDTIDILVDINLSIIKTFDPTEVPQGTLQSFTIEVSNSGPSDAVDVSVTDSVNTSLEVQDVTVTSGTGDCSASAGQEVDCTVQIPAGQSVTVTVDYLVAPFLDEDPLFDGGAGDEFRFVFVNGSILEGSTSTGEVYLDGADVSGNATIITSLTRNDLTIDPDGAGPDPAFTMHLSCSDPFTGGWGQSGGPIEGVDDNWQIAFFTIARYNPQGFLKNCGNVVNDFEVPNTAFATGTDSSGTETVSDDATVTVQPGITIDRLQTKGKRLTVRLTNLTGDNKAIVDVLADWPAGNGNLKKVWLTQDGTSWVIWSGTDDPPDALLDASDLGWNGATLSTGEGILRFDFANKVAKTGYTIRVNFDDGTFLDISQ